MHMNRRMTICAFIVLGMGSVWDASSQPARHPYFETGVEEAVIAYSAPQPWHAEATPFITHSLNHMFRGKPWNFTHVDQHTERIIPRTGGSVVLHQLHQDKPRLPSALYDSPVPLLAAAQSDDDDA